MREALVILGAGCIAAAILGGGLKLPGMDFPLFDSRWKKALLAALGAVLMLLGLSDWLRGLGGAVMAPATPAASGGVINETGVARVDGDRAQREPCRSVLAGPPQLWRAKYLLADADWTYSLVVRSFAQDEAGARRAAEDSAQGLRRSFPQLDFDAAATDFSTSAKPVPAVLMVRGIDSLQRVCAVRRAAIACGVAPKASAVVFRRASGPLECPE